MANITSEKPKKRQKIYEEDGVYVSPSDHWELIEIPLTVVGGKGNLGLRLPQSLVSHLGLERGDILTIALNHGYIRKNERKKLNLELVQLPLKVSNKLLQLNKHRRLVQEFLNSSLIQAKIKKEEYQGISIYLCRHPELKNKVKVHFVQGIGWIEKQLNVYGNA